MIRSGLFGISALLFLAVQPVMAQTITSQAELKQNALSVCAQAARETYGDDAIVAVRNRVEWQRPISRLNWHDGLGANVRMVLRVDDSSLVRVMCSVDQRYQVRLSTDTVVDVQDAGLFAASQLSNSQ